MDFKDIKFDSEVKIVDKRKKIAIKNEKLEIIGVAYFDVEDNTVYKKLLEIVDILTNGAKEEEKTDINIDNISTEKLETLEDFEKANTQFSKIRNILNFRDEICDKVIDKTDEIFGNGVAKIALLGGKNISNILPLIEVALTLAKPNRDKKTNQYKRTQKSEVIK